jgi:hypothetical protein
MLRTFFASPYDPAHAEPLAAPHDRTAAHDAPVATQERKSSAKKYANFTGLLPAINRK